MTPVQNLTVCMKAPQQSDLVFHQIYQTLLSPDKPLNDSIWKLSPLRRYAQFRDIAGQKKLGGPY